MILKSDTFDLVFECIKGALKPALGSTWSYSVALPTFGLDGDRGSTDSISTVLQQATVRKALLSNLDQDVKLALPSSAENIYGFGKQAARLAQLVHVGKRLQDALWTSHSDDAKNNYNATNSTSANKKNGGWGAAHSKTLKSIVEGAQKSLKDSLELLLCRNVSDALVFDEDLGGIVSVDGLWDSQADFGNGRYNDHHFHYGYLVRESGQRVT